MRTKAGYVLVKAFFSDQLTMQSWLTSLKKSSEVGISHNFFFLNFTAVPQGFSDGFKSKKSPKYVLFA